MKTYNFKVYHETMGFWAECIELEGCVTEADTFDQLYENMQTVLDLYLEDLYSPQLPLKFHFFFAPYTR